MSSIKRLQKQLEETEKRIEEKKQEIQLGLGEEIINSLELDYDDLNLVKDRKAMVDKIKIHLSNNFYQDNSEKIEEENQNPNTNENNNYNENKNNHLVNNQ